MNYFNHPSFAVMHDLIGRLEIDDLPAQRCPGALGLLSYVKAHGGEVRLDARLTWIFQAVLDLVYCGYLQAVEVEPGIFDVKLVRRGSK